MLNARFVTLRAGACLGVASAVLSSCTTIDGSPRSSSPMTTVGQAFERLPNTSAASTCGPGSDVTKQRGKLTVATDSPAYLPWFVDDNPANGKGFEGGVVRAVAQRLGFSEDQVSFIRVRFADALAPGEKKFDFDINQVTIYESRRGAVDFSSPYYLVGQGIVAIDDSAAARAKSATDLAGLRIGGERGSTSLVAVHESVPNAQPVEYGTTADAKKALRNGAVDAIVVDLPTALQITRGDIKNATVVGQIAPSNDVAEFFGLVLEKDSAMTKCVSAAVDALYADGELQRLADQWLSTGVGVPLLR